MEGTANISVSQFVIDVPDWSVLLQESRISWGGIADILISMGAAVARGWIKGELYTTRGVCLFGAFIYGTGTCRDKQSAESRVIGSLLAEVIRQERRETPVPALYKSWNVAVWFNDHENTGKEDVLQVIWTAVKIARGMDAAGEKVVPQDYPDPWKGLPPVPQFMPVMPSPGSYVTPLLAAAGV